jgi:hypothetical protein
METALLDGGGDAPANRLRRRKNPAKCSLRIRAVAGAFRSTSPNKTDTPSFVSAAVSQGLVRLATHSATDRQLMPAASAGNVKVAKEGGGGSAT